MNPAGISGAGAGRRRPGPATSAATMGCPRSAGVGSGLGPARAPMGARTALRAGPALLPSLVRLWASGTTRGDLAERMQAGALRGDFDGRERVRREFGISG